MTDTAYRGDLVEILTGSYKGFIGTVVKLPGTSPEREHLGLKLTFVPPSYTQHVGDMLTREMWYVPKTACLRVISPGLFNPLKPKSMTSYLPGEIRNLTLETNGRFTMLRAADGCLVKLIRPLKSLPRDKATMWEVEVFAHRNSNNVGKKADISSKYFNSKIGNFTTTNQEYNSITTKYYGESRSISSSEVSGSHQQIKRGERPTGSPVYCRRRTSTIASGRIGN